MSQETSLQHQAKLASWAEAANATQLKDGFLGERLRNISL